jgi:hypothetical protein
MKKIVIYNLLIVIFSIILNAKVYGQNLFKAVYNGDIE